MTIVVAIDGPAAAGKGTLARRVAKDLNLAYLDTGLLYRATGFAVIQAGGDLDDANDALKAAQNLTPTDLENEKLRHDEAAQAASKVAVVQPVRDELLEFQRRFASQPPAGKAGAVLDGRDIGTVVCPDAPVKLFVTASCEVRAQRRLKELQDRGLEAIYAQVLQDMKDRDARDSQRAAAPLKAADDAVILDTSDLGIEEVIEQAKSIISEKA
ncbi:cytidylate kinase [Candidatus Terasakiella magnetica]|uniref:Cytidylate kinase n=1 Tax=Candidatus Terasakiella magnetica TaxID=1867952 RepID=A0A1C3RFP7_9PROT|nr:(d)CMP kinase [Candidatus Terasakiella magnetica]SCA56117.1 cytidylate kinase [Candidatus Terasakiella magnetica]